MHQLSLIETNALRRSSV